MPFFTIYPLLQYSKLPRTGLHRVGRRPKEQKAQLSENQQDTHLFLNFMFTP